MPRDFTAVPNFPVEMARDEPKPVALISIATSGATLYFNNGTETFTFGGNDYVPFPFRFEKIDESLQGSIPEVRLVLSGAISTDQANALVAAWRADTSTTGIDRRLRGRAVIIRLAFWQDDGDGTYSLVTDADYGFTLYISTSEYQLGEAEWLVQLGLKPRIVAEGVLVPGRTVMRNLCQWKYTDSDTCKYTGVAVAGPGGETDYCSLVLDDAVYGCLAHETNLTGQLARFGGFPGVIGYLSAPIIGFEI